MGQTGFYIQNQSQTGREVRPKKYLWSERLEILWPSHITLDVEKSSILIFFTSTHEMKKYMNTRFFSSPKSREYFINALGLLTDESLTRDISRIKEFYPEDT